MEVSGQLQSTSSIYQELAQKKSQLANIDKREIEKSTDDNYDKISSFDEKYDKRDYQRVLSKFKNLDAETKIHEQTHASSASTTAPISYNYQVGPDGKLYASGGSVRFDTSIPKDEASANVKLEQLKDASSAVDELSAADAQVARTANLNKLLLQSKGENHDHK